MGKGTISMKANLAAWVFAAQAGIGLAVLPAAQAQEDEETACAPDGEMQFLCGIQGAEDILHLGESRWLLASGMGAEDSGGALHLIDGREKTFEVLFPSESAGISPDTTMYAKCPGAPDPETFSAHGLSLSQVGPPEDGTHKLLAINHAREAVEVFTIQETRSKPDVTWVGCVAMPDGTYTNSVAALPEGGFVATKMFDPSKEGAFGEIMAGKVTGLVYEWSPEEGFNVVPGSAMSGPNGIEVSEDGTWIYVAAFGTRELVRLSRDGSSPEHEAIAVSFSADNLRWTENRRLLVAGSNPPDPNCNGEDCPGGWTVVSWDPKEMTTEPILSYPATSPLTGVSVATRALGYLWIGSFNDDQVGYIPVEE